MKSFTDGTLKGESFYAMREKYPDEWCTYRADKICHFHDLYEKKPTHQDCTNCGLQCVTQVIEIHSSHLWGLRPAIEEQGFAAWWMRRYRSFRNRIRKQMRPTRVTKGGRLVDRRSRKKKLKEVAELKEVFKDELKVD